MTESELKHQSEIADARLEVAEQLWWPIAILAAAVVYLKWSNWFLIVAAVVAVYFFGYSPISSCCGQSRR